MFEYAKKGDRLSNRKLYGRMGTAMTDDNGDGTMVAQDDGAKSKWVLAGR